MVCAIRTGATSAATELNVMVATAITTLRFSSATSGTKRLIPLRSDAGGRGLLPESSVYFIVAGAALGVEELDVFGRCLHQLLMRSDSQHLSLHQQDDLVVIHYVRNLLRHRDERDPRIVLLHVRQNRLFRRGVDPRCEIVEQKHSGIEGQRASQHD